MAARDFSLTITAAAQPLSVVLSDTQRGGKVDESYRQILLSCDTDCYIGSSSSLTTSLYGYKLLAAATAPLVLGAFESGPLKLSDLYVIGTSGKLHILGVPF